MNREGIARGAKLKNEWNKVQGQSFWRPPDKKVPILNFQERLLAEPAEMNESEDTLFKYRIEFKFFKTPIANSFITEEIGAIFTEQYQHSLKEKSNRSLKKK